MYEIGIITSDQDNNMFLKTFAENMGVEVLAADTKLLPDVGQIVKGMLEQGVKVIISRGLMAKRIREYTTIPVVEMRMTKMEAYQLILKAKFLCRKERPRIALVCSKNIISDVTDLGEMAGVDFFPYLAGDYEEITEFYGKAMRADMDVLIGGSDPYRGEQDTPFLFVKIATSQEGIQNALRIAKQVLYTLEIDRKYMEKQNAILDYTSNGLILINGKGEIDELNLPAEGMLKCERGQVIGHDIEEVLPVLKGRLLSDVLNQNQEKYSIQQKRGNSVLMVSITPISQDNENFGAVVSLTEGAQIESFVRRQQLSELERVEMEDYSFDRLPVRSVMMRGLLERAASISSFAPPVLLEGPSGTEKVPLAFCMFQKSPYAQGTFRVIECDGRTPDELTELLFGNDDLCHRHRGVLFFENVHALSLENQKRMLGIMREQRMLTGSMRPLCWMVFASDRSLKDYVEKGIFRSDLYYTISALSLRIPGLEERPEDIVSWAQFYFKKMQEAYGRYIHLTQDAWKTLVKTPFPGNLDQLESVCQRIIVESPRRTVSVEILSRFLDQEKPEKSAKSLPEVKVREALYPDAGLPDISEEPEAEKIRKLLNAYHGNRTKAATALGVSTTTLWRRMKEYGISES